MLEWLDRLPAGTRKILIHINNTNPILDEASSERALLRDKGIEVAWDGMEIVL
jgi:pyrroloquinoline quinone biosynthesis protein B